MNLKDSMRRDGEALRKSLDLGTFGEAMDGVIRRSDVGLLVKKKAGEAEWTVSGAGCGAVMDFYIFLNALEPIFLRMLKEMERAGGALDAERLAGELFGVMKETLVSAAAGREDAGE